MTNSIRRDLCLRMPQLGAARGPPRAAVKAKLSSRSRTRCEAWGFCVSDDRH